MIFVEDSPVDQVPHILLVSLSKVKHSFGVALGGLAKALAFGIFSNTLQNCPYGTCKLLHTLFIFFWGRLQSLPGSGAYEATYI